MPRLPPRTCCCSPRCSIAGHRLTAHSYGLGWMQRPWLSLLCLVTRDITHALEWLPDSQITPHRAWWHKSPSSAVFLSKVNNLKLIYCDLLATRNSQFQMEDAGDNLLYVR